MFITTAYAGRDDLQYLELNDRFEEFHWRYNKCQHHVLVENLQKGADRIMSEVDKTFGVKGKWRKLIHALAYKHSSLFKKVRQNACRSNCQLLEKMLEGELEQEYNYNIDNYNRIKKENKDLTEKELRQHIKLNSLKTKDKEGVVGACLKDGYKQAFEIMKEK